MDDKGRSGERRAAQLLEGKGYRVLARNFRSRRGEVDLVVSRGEDLVFVEVKSWAALPVDSLEQALATWKQQKIADAARWFLFQHPEYREYRLRFDVVFVPQDPDGARHYENAFDGVEGKW